MKNIHILPTDKPILDGSINYILKCIKEFKIYNKQYKIGDILDELSWDFDSNYWKPQNIYITNDEEIKEGDYFIHFSHGTTTLLKCKSVNSKEIIDNEGKSCWVEYSYKIILTTDQDLIKDGVKELSERWIEYIVNNPKCEYLEVTERKVKKYDGTTLYKIIIPKEEPKQLNPEDFGLPKFGTKEFNDLCYKFMGGKPKQETLEEVLKNELEFIHNSCRNFDFDLGFKTGGLIGAKWQQDRMYSEEEVWKLVNKLNETLNIGSDLTLEQWFEKFKKK